MRSTLAEVIRENPCPRHKSSNRGRPPIHSKDKLDFACFLMMANNNTYRGIESDLRDLKTHWSDEPVPDHTMLVRHMQTIPEDWMDDILAETARWGLIPAVWRRPDMKLSRDQTGKNMDSLRRVKEPTGNTISRRFWGYRYCWMWSVLRVTSVIRSCCRACWPK